MPNDIGTIVIRMTADMMIENYIKLRERKKAIEERHKEELAPFKTHMDQLEGWMLEAMDHAGLDSMKSPHGTCYKSMRTSATVCEWESFLAYVREREAWDLLEHRVAKKAAEELMKETNAPIPGVDTSREVVVNVRKAGEKPAISGK